MEFTATSAANIVLALLPGFLAERIERMLFYLRSLDKGNEYVSALIYTFVINALYALIGRGLFNLDYPTFIPESAGCLRANPQIGGIALLLLLSISVGGLCGILKYKDWPLKFLREKEFTKRTFHSSFWSEMMTRKKEFVQIEFKNGNRICGYLDAFDLEFGKGPVIFLTGAKWQQLDGQAVDDRVPREILISGEQIEIIEFYKDGNTDV